ncbi:MAG: 4-hydroxythreonine-4-phosphate dehydrogenase PdxA [Deltaproteobacteria bacterium]
MTASPRPLLAITMGDPAGIGPEVVVKAASVGDVRACGDLVVFGDRTLLERVAADVSISIEIVPVDSPEAAREHTSTKTLPVIAVSDLADDADLAWGKPSKRSDAVQIQYIRAAYEAVVSDAADAIVTAPISKASLKRAGADFPGHTEMLASWCGVQGPLMMLAGPTLKVIPMTIHVPLRDVASLLTQEKIESALRVTDETLRQFFWRRRPRIVVAGLNPHAGEGGMFGDEEQRIIRPAVEACSEAGIDVAGPFPADTVYQRTVSGEFDVVIGMYHDQALIPLKLFDFDQAVNVTLGLPIIRTSVDHGTAYDIAGRGVASAGSMMAALRLASEMAENRVRTPSV